MPFVGDVFGLNTVYDRQVLNVEQNNFLNWPESAVYGYFIGGNIPPTSVSSTVNRLEFSTDVISLPGKNLPTASPFDGGFYNMGSFSNPNSSYGYLAGGNQGLPTSCVIRRLDFSNETLSLPGKNLPTVRVASRGTNNNSYGYVVGGYTAPLYINTITRLDFSSETISLPGKNLPTTIGDHASIYDNSGLYGYFGGGYTNPPGGKISTIARLEFSTETTSLPGKNLSTARGPVAGTSSISYGYIVGGDNFPAHINTISRFDFSTENISNPGNNLPSGLRATSSGTSSNYFGYFAGGEAPSVSPGATCSIFRIDFSTEISSSPSIQLPVRARNISALTGGKSINRGSKTYGYFVGGAFIPPGLTPVTYYNTIIRLDFSNSTLSSPSITPNNNLPSSRSATAAVSTNTYGYIGGGETPTLSCTISRFDFSNETVSDPAKNLPSARHYLAATSSSSYGYFGGGYAPGAIGTVSKIDFSNEVLSNPGTNLPANRGGLSAVSSTSYGYFGGGGPGSSNTIQRIDFSNETFNLPGTDLTYRSTVLSATSNNRYGYFGGGYGPGPVITQYLCTISRLDFSNETTNTLSANLPDMRGNSSTVTDNFYGYFGGSGIPPSIGSSPATPSTRFQCTIQRLDFSSDTLSNLPVGLPQPRGYMAGLSNSN